MFPLLPAHHVTTVKVNIFDTVNVDITQKGNLHRTSKYSTATHDQD